ncbi:hypothetical protein Micbo1qcDRAFT_232236 [Microdochium bolleyi]|uniref:Transcription factor domain-containing protein n=1 Tax=Microdochium bolleyi TaxID=196109 RepID=A0A136JCE5_9PEZI|nr:hypothetical protein Micbo1qcDRAFT_232236 [Microdochium bolleyi]
MAQLPVTTTQMSCGILSDDMLAGYHMSSTVGDAFSGSASPQWEEANLLISTYGTPTDSSPAFSQTSYTSPGPGLAIDQFSQVPRIPHTLGIPPPPAPPHYHDQCIDAFYSNFYPAHPIGPPRDKLHSQQVYSSKLDDPTTSPSPLIAAMMSAGSRYLDPSPDGTGLADAAVQQLYSPNFARDGHLVQAMLIVAVCLDADLQRETARVVCADAERLAVEIGMGSASFAAVHAQGDPRLEESWRRTWWELYVVKTAVEGCATGPGNHYGDGDGDGAGAGGDKQGFANFFVYEEESVADGYGGMTYEGYRYPPLIA